MSAEPNGWHVIRDELGTLHIPEEGLPSCGADGALVDAIHPSDVAAIWCSDCLQKVANLQPRRGTP